MQEEAFSFPNCTRKMYCFLCSVCGCTHDFGGKIDRRQLATIACSIRIYQTPPTLTLTPTDTDADCRCNPQMNHCMKMPLVAPVGRMVSNRQYFRRHFKALPLPAFFLFISCIVATIISVTSSFELSARRYTIHRRGGFAKAGRGLSAAQAAAGLPQSVQTEVDVHRQIAAHDQRQHRPCAHQLQPSSGNYRTSCKFRS